VIVVVVIIPSPQEEGSQLDFSSMKDRLPPENPRAAIHHDVERADVVGGRVNRAGLSVGRNGVELADVLVGRGCDQLGISRRGLVGLVRRD
jgi:hypothetical protein